MRKAANGLTILIRWIYGVGFSLLLLLVAADCIPYAFRPDFPLPNWAYLLAAVALWLGLRWLAQRVPGGAQGWLKRHNRPALAVATALLFALSLWLISQYYFVPGWDSGIVLDAAWGMANGEAYPLGSYESWYYSLAPNNLFLTWIYRQVLALAKLCGAATVQQGLLWLLGLQALLCAVAGACVQDAARRLTGSLKTAWLAWALFAPVGVLCPWVAVPYSDSLGCLFSILSVWLYLTARDFSGKMRLLLLGLLGFVAMAGFRLKPQLMIPLIAVAIVSLLGLWRGEISLPRLLRGGAALLAGMVLAFGMTKAAMDSLPVEIDPDGDYGMLHYVMVGLNPKNDGGYNDGDAAFTQSLPADRKVAGQLEKILFRLKYEFGVKGLIVHLTKKLLNTYGDGTFYWGKEGNFIRDPDTGAGGPLSGLLRGLFCGEDISLYGSVAQSLWMLVLLGCAGLGWCRRRPQDGQLALMLSLVGMTAYQLLFEARARYLISFTPLYVLAAVLGLERLFALLLMKHRPKA